MLDPVGVADPAVERGRPRYGVPIANIRKFIGVGLNYTDHALESNLPIPTEPVHTLLKITGDWQKFKGLPGSEGRLQPQAEKVDKQARFNEELAKVSNNAAE